MIHVLYLLPTDEGVSHQEVLEAASEAVSHLNFIQTTVQVEDHIPRNVANCGMCTELRK